MNSDFRTEKLEPELKFFGNWAEKTKMYGINH